MKKKNCGMIIAVVITVFCLCSKEDNNNPVNGGADERFLGNWKGTAMKNIMYDPNGNILSDTTFPTEGYYKVSSTEIIFYQLTDTCITVNGPFSYTCKGDTLTFTWRMFMSVTVNVTLENGILTHTHAMPIPDSTGQIIGTMATIVDHEKYSGSIPESSWPKNPCTMTF